MLSKNGNNGRASGDRELLGPVSGGALTGDQANDNRAHADAQTSHISVLLHAAGLRATRQRIELGRLLFRVAHRHVTADRLHREATERGYSLSLATVYNTLYQLRDAGLVREVVVDGQSSTFDTNTSDHQHYVNVETGEVSDIPPGEINLRNLPPPPDGMKVSHIDVLVRIRPRADSKKGEPDPEVLSEVSSLPDTVTALPDGAAQTDPKTKTPNKAEGHVVPLIFPGAREVVSRVGPARMPGTVRPPDQN